jgi:hypothetical protein
MLRLGSKLYKVLLDTFSATYFIQSYTGDTIGANFTTRKEAHDYAKKYFNV